MNLSRRTKNQVLWGSNLLLFLIKIVNGWRTGFPTIVGTELVWILAFILISLLLLFPADQWISNRFRHISLFLLTGAALGFTIAGVLKGSGMPVAEQLWVGVGIIAAVLHYSPSTRDEYLT